MNNFPLETAISLLGTLFLFFLGAVIGSFLHVMATRSAEGKSWVSGRSTCDYCHKLLKWFDMVPLLSFLSLRGRCRFCKKRIAPSHFVSEIAVGSIFAVWFSLFLTGVFQLYSPSNVVIALYWLIVMVTLMYSTLVDIKYLIIPDGSVVFLTLITIAYQLFLYNAGTFTSANAFATFSITTGLTVGMFLLWAVTKGKGLGFGDVKLMVPLGLIAGWPQSLVGLFLAFLIGALVGVLLIVLKRAQWRQPIPFGPFLIAGMLLSLEYGVPLWEWYLKLLR